MSRRPVNNPLALAVLSCLNERPMHPYEISTTLRERGKEASQEHAATSTISLPPRIAPGFTPTS